MTTRRKQFGRIAPSALAAMVSMTAFALLFAACGGGGGTAATPRKPPPDDPQPPASSLTVVTTSLADGYTNRYYEQVLEVTGGLPPYEWSVSGLPPGLNLGVSREWMIVGYPTQAGSFNLTFQVRDSRSRTASGSFALLIKESIRILPGEIPEGGLTFPTAIRSRRREASRRIHGVGRPLPGLSCPPD